jgi:hypothetical protein
VAWLKDHVDARHKVYKLPLEPHGPIRSHEIVMRLGTLLLCASVAAVEVVRDHCAGKLSNFDEARHKEPLSGGMREVLAQLGDDTAACARRVLELGGGGTDVVVCVLDKYGTGGNCTHFSFSTMGPFKRFVLGIVLEWLDELWAGAGFVFRGLVALGLAATSGQPAFRGSVDELNWELFRLTLIFYMPARPGVPPGSMAQHVDSGVTYEKRGNLRLTPDGAPSALHFEAPGLPDVHVDVEIGAGEVCVSGADLLRMSGARVTHGVPPTTLGMVTMVIDSLKEVGKAN